MIKVDTIPTALFHLDRMLYCNGYLQEINRGSFEGEQVYRLQHPPVSITIEDPLNLYDMPKTITIPEIDHYCAELYNPDKPDSADYTYGERIEPQLVHIIDMLLETPGTNQAIINIGRPEDRELEHPPCLQTMHFLLFEGKLHLSVLMRSNDIGSAFLLNLYGFAYFGWGVAAAVNQKFGSLIYQCTAPHYYSHSISEG